MSIVPVGTRSDRISGTRRARISGTRSYLVECYKQAQLAHSEGLSAWGRSQSSNPAADVDGYGFVKAAISMQAQNAEIEFAAALITGMGLRQDCEQYVRRAVAGAKGNALLAENLASHFGKQRIAEALATLGSK